MFVERDSAPAAKLQNRILRYVTANPKFTFLHQFIPLVFTSI